MMTYQPVKQPTSEHSKTHDRLTNYKTDKHDYENLPIWSL